MKKTILAMFGVIIIGIFVSCNNYDNTSIKEETMEYLTNTPISETETETVSESVEELSLDKNPLTGLKGYNSEAVGKRPVAVMINNIKYSLPQYGIEKADIMYEIPVEGGITRMMGVYADYTDVPNICSVRSCRYYYPIIAYGMDAIYFHWGSDQTIALDTLNRLNIDHFDGGGDTYKVLFFRDEERMQTYATEHTGYLKGSEIPQVLEEYGVRTDINSKNSKGLFLFNDEDNPVKPQGAVCMSATLSFSSGYYSTFEYDSATNTYKKYHSGEPHVDSATGNQLAYTNVFALCTDIGLRGVGSLVDVALDNGEGYYISNGVAQQIKWIKVSDDEPIKILDLNGEEIHVNAGKSYIGIIGNDRTIKIE